jgi:hypothetical protein
VGTAGFPFPSKRMDMACTAAKLIGGEAVIVAPQHRFYNPAGMYDRWGSMAGGRMRLLVDFMPQEEVSKVLAACALNIYFAEEDYAPGQSGSVRMILAAGRPTIVRRYGKTRGLFEYEDEIYFVNTEQEAYNAAQAIWQMLVAGSPVKRPSRLLRNISWNSVAERYAELVRSLVKVKEMV